MHTIEKMHPKMQQVSSHHRMAHSTPQLSRLKMPASHSGHGPHEHHGHGHHGHGHHHHHISQPSLIEKMKERRAHPHDDFVNHVKGEHEAKKYMDALEDNSMAKVNEALQIVGSMVEKGNDTHEELKRQGEVVRQANRDIQDAEDDIDDTSHMLRGIRSVRGKLSNMVSWRSKSQHDRTSFGHYDDHPEPESRFRRSVTMPKSLPSYRSNSNQTKQDQIHGGLEQLSHGLEIVEQKQLEIRDEFEHQEKYLKQLDHNIDHIDNRIHDQTNLMKTITHGN